MTPDPTPEQIAESMVFYDKLGIHVQDAPVALPGGGTFAQRSVQLFPPRGFEDERGLKDVVRSLRAIVVAALRRRAEVEAGRWIPVAARLPEPWQWVIAYDPRYGRDGYSLCTFEEKVGKLMTAEGWEPKATHWQPLPAPPKEDAPPAPAAGQAAARGEEEPMWDGAKRSLKRITAAATVADKLAVKWWNDSRKPEHQDRDVLGWLKSDIKFALLAFADEWPAPTPSPEVPAAVFLPKCHHGNPEALCVECVAEEEEVLHGSAAPVESPAQAECSCAAGRKADCPLHGTLADVRRAERASGDFVVTEAP